MIIASVDPSGYQTTDLARCGPNDFSQLLKIIWEPNAPRRRWRSAPIRLFDASHAVLDIFDSHGSMRIFGCCGSIDSVAVRMTAFMEAQKAL